MELLFNNLANIFIFLCILSLFLYFLNTLSINPERVLRLLFKESKDLLIFISERKPTAGGINMLVVILHFIFGVAILILSGADILQQLLGFLSEKNIETFDASVTGIVLLIVLFSITALSLVFVSLEGEDR